MTWGKNGTKIVLLVHAVMFSQTGHTEMIADNHHLSASEITNNEHLAQNRVAQNEQAFTLYDNYDLTGTNLSTLSLSDVRDLQNCMEACQIEAHCQGYTYNKFFRSCSFKKTVGTLRFDPSSVAGVSGSLPPASDAPFEMELIEERRFVGNSYRSQAISSYAECERICEEDQQCVGTSYAVTQHTCRLFGTVAKIVTDAGTASAMKRQIAQ